MVAACDAAFENKGPSDGTLVTSVSDINIKREPSASQQHVVFLGPGLLQMCSVADSSVRG